MYNTNTKIRCPQQNDEDYDIFHENPLFYDCTHETNTKKTVEMAEKLVYGTLIGLALVIFVISVFLIVVYCTPLQRYWRMESRSELSSDQGDIVNDQNQNTQAPARTTGEACSNKIIVPLRDGNNKNFTIMFLNEETESDPVLFSSDDQRYYKLERVNGQFIHLPGYDETIELMAQSQALSPEPPRYSTTFEYNNES